MCATPSSPTWRAGPRTLPPKPDSRSCSAIATRTPSARRIPRPVRAAAGRRRADLAVRGRFGDGCAGCASAASRRCSSTAWATPTSARSQWTTSPAADSRSKHLLAQGRRRIAFVGGPHAHPPGERAPRRRPSRGCRARTVARGDRDGTPRCIDGRAAGQAIVARSDRPDAVFAANDLLAMGVLQALVMQGAGVRVPDEIALIGYDDIDFASAAVVPLSSIRQPASSSGAPRWRCCFRMRRPSRSCSSQSSWHASRPGRPLPKGTQPRYVLHRRCERASIARTERARSRRAHCRASRRIPSLLLQQ